MDSETKPTTPITASKPIPSLILPDGNAAFQKKIHDWTPGKLGNQKFFNETGCQVTNHEEERYDGIAPSGWALPKNFCPDCGKTDIIPMPGPDGTLRHSFGLTIFDEPLPHLMVRPGDVAVYHICHKCMHEELHGKKELVAGDGKKLRHIRREERVKEYIKVMISAGETPVVEGERK